MKKILSCAAVLAVLAVPALAQEGGMPMPKPGPEHELLKQDVGEWDATVEAFDAPDGKPTVSKGVETNRMLGGMWLITDFKSEMMGMPFEGHGVGGWDPAKKKYVGTWTDSMSSSIARSEGDYDPKTRTSTGWMEMTDMTGKVQRMKGVTEWKDADTRVFSMYMPGPDGKEFCGMRITYKRRK